LIALYLWVVFGLLVTFKSVVLAEHHVDFAYHGFAIINALALAKVMLTAKDLHLGEKFNEAPLIYPTLLKSALFTLVMACIKILEDAAIGFYHGQSFHQSIADLGGGTWKAILTPMCPVRYLCLRPLKIAAASRCFRSSHRNRFPLRKF